MAKVKKSKKSSKTAPEAISGGRKSVSIEKAVNGYIVSQWDDKSCRDKKYITRNRQEAKQKAGSLL